MRTTVKLAVSALAIAAAGTTFASTNAFAARASVQVSRASAQVSKAPRQSVGFGLIDTQLIHFPTNHSDPWQREPDIYIGTTDEGQVANPIAPHTTRIYHVRVTNTGNVTETMAVFSSGAYMSSKGVFRYIRVSKCVDNASSWTKVTPARAVLAPGKSYIATVRVTVPAHTRAQKTYAVLWAGPVVNAVKHGKAGKHGQPVKPGIILAIYVGIREYLTVS
jgi:hypothetical protein